MELNFPKIEQEILKFWKEKNIFTKSIKQRVKARDFIFYEGPPTANAKPGIHHVETRVFKDIICRYKTMQGFRVSRKAGWDTHGLPVELSVEKKLGLKNKKEIEKYGIADFNKQCKESVWQYKQDWEKLTERIGYWLDMEHPYITYENDYIETLWWIIKQIWQKGLLYQDYKVVPYCPRCGTSLSSHEVALGYKKVKENSIYIKFKLKEYGSRYFLVWTTTPWTLPGNVALAVNPDIDYVEAKLDSNESYILAKDRLDYLKKQLDIKNIGIKKEFKGKDLVGLEYEQLIDFAKPDKPAFRVVPGKFVSIDEGTGIVHIAPAFGEDDMELAKKNDLPILMTVDELGRIKPEIKPWAGMDAKEADPLIIQELQDSILGVELYEHDYPFCWRCHSPLLYYAKESWFIKMQAVKKDLIENNRKINWVPSHLREGRFGEWLKELKDWAFSRERYWGTPLPIWQCKECGHKEVLGSKQDLLGQKFSTNKYYILRHGQTDYQVNKKEWVYPSIEKQNNVHLTVNGENQIKKASRELKNKKIDIIYFSDIGRTRQTAEIINKVLGAEIISDKRLWDMNLGIYHGGRKDKFFKDFPKTIESFYGKKPEGGENWGEVRRRMMGCLNDIDRKHKNKTILIISHGDPLWLLEGTCKGLTEKELLKIKIKEKYVKTGEWRKLNFKNMPLDKEGRVDFHRPYIDEVKFLCPQCQSLMERVREVADVWFDSGSMPFAQYHYPFDKKDFQFPAEYISEAIDQTRGWFYTLLAVSTLLGKGTPYKNVISLGHVLDEKGEKMSKSKGNVVDPWYIIEKYGIDAVRWYFYTVNQPGEPKLFSEKDIDQALKRFILIFWNCFTFYQTYKGKSEIRNPKSKNILDKWIVSRLNELVQDATEKLDKYDVTGAARTIEDFIVNDLSLWYIRRSRKRFEEASATLRFVLLTLSKLTAPFIPFLSEEIYRGISNSKSVHLENWPKVDKKLITPKLNGKMVKVREIVNSALAERAKAGIKVRQPLASLLIPEKIDKELLGLIKEEVNVKKIIFSNTLILDTKITPELKEEGIIREVIRQIQEMRKEAKLKPKDKILVKYSGTPELNKILERNKKMILGEIKAKDFKQGKGEKEVKIDQQNLWLAIKKL